MRLNRKFFIQPTLQVAKDILGKYIIRRLSNGKKLVAKIVETEAYIGPEDKASHGYQGKRTERNAAEFLIGGHVYIYLVYGMYWQFNISTWEEGTPECVLIRAAEPIEDITESPSGPGRFCRALKLDKSFYGHDLVNSSKLWLEDRGNHVKPSDIGSGSRIGIDYAGEWAAKPLRFYIKGNPWVSKA